jgi:hypothetical protein
METGLSGLNFSKQCLLTFADAVHEKRNTKTSLATKKVQVSQGIFILISTAPLKNSHTTEENPKRKYFQWERQGQIRYFPALLEFSQH